MPATARAAAPAAPAAPDAARTARSARRALFVLGAGAFASVLAALPFPLFQLDRYTVPKELVLHLSAGGSALILLAAARRYTVFAVDALLAAFLALTLASALVATNGWLAVQAFGVSLSGAALFWASRAVARAGYGRPLLAALAGAVVLGAVTALAQAYGLVSSPLFNLTRAPGGTFGNRNFVAHLAAIGFPVLTLVAVQARERGRAALALAGVALVSATLFLTRSRAGWLGAGLSSAFLATQGLLLGRLWHEPALRTRFVRLGAAAAVGVAAAWLLPNRLNWRSDSPYLESLAGMANYKDGSGRGRLIQYQNSMAMAAAHPLLGVGPGNWPVHYPSFMAPNDPSFDADDFIPTNPWPSSDWVAMIAERGFPAGLLFGVVGLALALAAWMRARRSAAPARALPDLTLVATLLATAIVAAFDAVLLLPVPTFFVSTIVGALASTAQPLRELAPAPHVRRRVTTVAGVIGALLVGRAASRVVAMGLYDGGGPSAQRWAARLDPGSFRIHMLLGMAEAAKGRCKSAVPHARTAYDLFPNYPAPRRVLRRCGVRKAVSLVTAPGSAPLHIPSNPMERAQ